MTVSHLLFAAVLSGYMGLAAQIEERDLVAHFGDLYREYSRRVPMFVPRWNSETTSASSRNQNVNQVRENVVESMQTAKH